MSGVGEGGVNGQAWSGAEAMLRSLLADTEASQNMKGQMLRDTQRRAKRPLVDATKIQMTFFVCANENGKFRNGSRYRRNSAHEGQQSKAQKRHVKMAFAKLFFFFKSSYIPPGETIP